MNPQLIDSYHSNSITYTILIGDGINSRYVVYHNLGFDYPRNAENIPIVSHSEPTDYYFQELKPNNFVIVFIRPIARHSVKIIVTNTHKP